MSEKTKGILLVALGAVFFSAKAIIIKMTYRDYNEVDALTLLTLRFGLAFPFFVAVGFWRFKKEKMTEISKKDIGWIAFLSVLGYYLASLFDFKGLHYISAGLERVILFIYPTLVVLFSWLFFKKKITKKAFLALLLTYVGIVTIAFEPRVFEAKDAVLGITFILISAITYALYLTFGGEMIKKMGSINFNSISLLFASGFVILHFIFLNGFHIFHYPAGVYWYGLALAIFSTVIPTFMLMEGIRILGANLGAIVGSVGPISTIILGCYFLGETLSLQEIIGSVLVLLGVLMIGKAT
jgi:drug/metabolite transporter (DMT)-like permease